MCRCSVLEVAMGALLGTAIIDCYGWYMYIQIVQLSCFKNIVFLTAPTGIASQLDAGAV